MKLNSTGSKARAFKDKELKHGQYFVYNYYNDTQLALDEKESKYQSWSKWRDSFVCLQSPTDSSRLYCLHPKKKCAFSSSVPKDFSSEEIKRFAISKGLVIFGSSVAIHLLITPIKILLQLLFKGYCQPKVGSPKRKYYNIVVIVAVVVAVILQLFWIGSTLFLILQYFTNVSNASKKVSVITTVCTWMLNVTIMDFLSCLVTSLVMNPGHLLCGNIPNDVHDIRQLEKTKEMTLKSEHQHKQKKRSKKRDGSKKKMVRPRDNTRHPHMPRGKQSTNSLNSNYSGDSTDSTQLTQL